MLPSTALHNLSSDSPVLYGLILYTYSLKFFSACPSFLDDVGQAGECAQQYLELLLHKLSDDSTGKWKSYLAMRGVLPRLGGLITQEIEHLLVLEETTLSSDLSQGYALTMLTG